ncbi:MAG: pilus assembly protein TadG-related protein, partial [Acidimicrobiales bacterium]|nr:pilus assembly protein TadG-related protein [Acidimicrobiales bacterium]
MDAGQKLRGDGDRPLVGDGGYVVALTGLLILPLIAAVGLAVDLGAWYARAAQMQKAADAAALAGAAYLPDEGLAAIRAQAVAAQNGFDDADADITVTVTPVGSQQLQVSIDDNDVNQYFTSLFVSNVDVARSAVAEYVLPVAMGSPRNYLGTGNDPSGALTAA